MHAEHDYPRTRILFGSYDVHIETFKRTPEEIMEIVAANAEWDLEHKREFRWDDLNWKPEDDRFFRVDRAGHRPIFFVMVLRRRKATLKAIAPEPPGDHKVRVRWPRRLPVAHCAEPRHARLS